MWGKFGDERTSGEYQIMVSLKRFISMESTAATDTLNPEDLSRIATVTVLNATDGMAVHNGVLTNTSYQNKRAEACDSTTNTITFSLQKAEPNLVDDDADGVMDNEDYGTPDKRGDFRFAMPANTVFDVWLNRVLWAPGNDATFNYPDADIAVGAADQDPPSTPSVLSATAVPGGSVRLAWSAASDSGSGMQRYRVYRWQKEAWDATYTFVHALVATPTAGTLEWTDDKAVNGNTYYYEVRAEDIATNVSPRSMVATAASDASAPVVSDDAVSSYVGTATIYLQATDSGSGVKNITYNVDGSSTTHTVTNTSTYVQIPGTGAHSLAYRAEDNVGNVTGDVVLPFDIVAPASASERVIGDSRYDVAVNAAGEAYPGFTGVKHVIITSGEDRAAADPLAASGLAGAYDGPLMLVKSTGVPTAVRNAIASMPETVTVHVVGGRASIPNSVITTSLAGISQGREHRADRRRQPLRARRRTSRRGINLVLGRPDFPTSTSSPPTVRPQQVQRRTRALADRAATAHAAAPREVRLRPEAYEQRSDGPRAHQALHRRRHADGERGRAYRARRRPCRPDVRPESLFDRHRDREPREDEGWLTYSTVGISAKLPDGLTGGACVGEQGGVLLLTETTRLSATPTRDFLITNGDSVAQC